MAELMEDFDFIHGTADNPNPMYVRLGEQCNVAIAQLVLEHLSDTQKVGGSSPTRTTKEVR